MTKGDEIIGAFDSKNLTSVDLIKQKAVELVNLIEELGIEPRRKSIAITHVETATMFAVKSLF